MFSRDSNVFKRCVRDVFIAGAFIFVAIVLSVNKEAPTSTPDTHTDTPVPQNTEHPTPAVFDAQSFYQTIIDNNLFRPLGWTPPRPTEPYCLMGMILPRSENTPPKAIIQMTARNTTLLVSTGEQIDASTEVVSIEGKRVVLSTDGQQRTLHLLIGF